MQTQIINKRGYLNQDFMFFHLRDQSVEEHAFHYHEFDKIVVLLSGSVTYTIEGKSYFLSPFDVLLVNHHDIHMPVIDKSIPYDRIVIWVNHDFIAAHSTLQYDLSLCFKLAKQRCMSLMRFSPEKKEQLFAPLMALENSFSSDEFAARLMNNTYFVQFLILLNRFALDDTTYRDTKLFKYDRKIDDILNYINSNLDSDLSAEALSRTFYISQSYLMHKFKTETGYPLHNYVLQKRLLNAKELILTNTPVIQAAQESGFNDYTTFLRAFKKLFNILPSEL